MGTTLEPYRRILIFFRHNFEIVFFLKDAIKNQIEVGCGGCGSSAFVFSFFKEPSAGGTEGGQRQQQRETEAKLFKTPIETPIEAPIEVRLQESFEEPTRKGQRKQPFQESLQQERPQQESHGQFYQNLAREAYKGLSEMRNHDREKEKDLQPHDVCDLQLRILLGMPWSLVKENSQILLPMQQEARKVRVSLQGSAICVQEMRESEMTNNA